MKNQFDDVWMMGIEGETYRELLEIAKKQNKTVAEVASEALKATINDGKKVSESKERKFLMEG